MAHLDWDLFSSYAGLLFLASVSIYAGSYASLPHSKPLPSGDRVDHDDDDDDDELEERMSSEDAWLFPVVGSVALGGLYVFVKYFGKEWVNWILGWYFSVAGIGSVWKSSVALARFILGNARWKKFDVFRVTIRKGRGSPALFKLSMRTPSIFLFPLAIVPSALYTFNSASRKSVLITDLLALSFSHNALSLLKLDSFKTGAILLSGLFFYDIWWVFGTEVMVKVATSLDVPIKLLWPKSLYFSDARGYTMLGLGDIVIPGTVVALALRYDLYRYTNASPKDTLFRKPYFWAALSAYILGLLATMTVMHTFGKAQPALLYLSPACILSFVITGGIRGELRDVWNWSDDPDYSSGKVPAVSGVVLEDEQSKVTITVEDKAGPDRKSE